MVEKYNCMGCHQFTPDQSTMLMGMKRYQDAQEQLPPKLLTEGARVDPEWLRKFLSNPSLSTTDTNRNGVRPYLQVRMPTFSFSDNELRKLVRFFQALSQQPMPYIPEQVPVLTTKETDMARSLFSSTAAPCLKCHATGDPAHDKIATAPNFLLAKERLKPDWAERWIIDPQAISPGTAMPSGLFKRENDHWVFSGPTPPSFQGYDKDHSKLLVDYIFQLTPEEQRRVAASMGRMPRLQCSRAASRTGRQCGFGAQAAVVRGRMLCFEIVSRSWSLVVGPRARASILATTKSQRRSNDRRLCLRLTPDERATLMNKKLWAAMFAALPAGVAGGLQQERKHQRGARHFAELGSEAGADRDANRSGHGRQRERHRDFRRSRSEGDRKLT